MTPKRKLHCDKDVRHRNVGSQDFIRERKFCSCGKLRGQKAVRKRWPDSLNESSELLLSATGNDPNALKVRGQTGFNEQWDFDGVGTGVEHPRPNQRMEDGLDTVARSAVIQVEANLLFGRGPGQLQRFTKKSQDFGALPQLANQIVRRKHREALLTQDL